MNVTLRDIDELGLVVPIRDLDLKILHGYHFIVDIKEFNTWDYLYIRFSNNDHSNIISAINLADEDLNDEKEKK